MKIFDIIKKKFEPSEEEKALEAAYKKQKLKEMERLGTEKAKLEVDAELNELRKQSKKGKKIRSSFLDHLGSVADNLQKNPDPFGLRPPSKGKPSRKGRNGY